MFEKKINKLSGVFDERIIKYKGHLGFPHYLPAKLTNGKLILYKHALKGDLEKKGPVQ